VKIDGEDLKNFLESLRERERLTGNVFSRFKNSVSIGEKLCFS
jgi:hypothetical protein